MDKTIKELNHKFSQIKEMGWIKSIRKGSTGIGITFESLLSINENNFEIPDFKGIEIKTKRSYSNAYTTLFNATPDGPHFREIERLKSNYGYPHSKYKKYKVLNNSVFSTQKTRIGIRYYFQLNIDRKKEKVFLLIFDIHGNLIEDEIFWYFNTLKEKLYRKLNLMAVIDGKTKKIGAKEYFKYFNLTVYKIKSFDEFLTLLEKGIIRVTFKINVFLSGRRQGEIHDHGTGFDIKESDLLKLYDVYPQ